MYIIFGTCVSHPNSLHFFVSDASTRIHLVHGNKTFGLVEVLRNCEWSSVCDDFWTDHDAKVACGQLGFLPYGMHIIAPVQYHLLSDWTCNTNVFSTEICLLCQPICVSANWALQRHSWQYCMTYDCHPACPRTLWQRDLNQFLVSFFVNSASLNYLWEIESLYI